MNSSRSFCTILKVPLHNSNWMRQLRVRRDQNSITRTFSPNNQGREVRGTGKFVWQYCGYWVSLRRMLFPPCFTAIIVSNLRLSVAGSQRIVAGWVPRGEFPSEANSCSSIGTGGFKIIRVWPVHCCFSPLTWCFVGRFPTCSFMTTSLRFLKTLTSETWDFGLGSSPGQYGLSADLLNVTTCIGRCNSSLI